MGRPRPLTLVLWLALLLAGSASAEEWMYDPTFRPGRPGDVLQEGPPPLLRAELDAFVDLVEAAFDLAIPLGPEQDLRDALEERYAKAGRDEREALGALVRPLAALRRAAAEGRRAEVDEGLSAFRRAIDAHLQEHPAWQSSEVVRRVLALRQAVAWPGTPPVHGVAAASWLELSEFVTCLARGERIESTDGQRSTLTGDLAQAFHVKPEEVRRRLRESHRLWLRTKAVWDAANAERRLELRWRAVDLGRRLLPPERQASVPTGGDLVAYARASGVLAAAQAPFDAWTNVAANPEAVLALLDLWLGAPSADRDDPLLYR